MGQPNSLEPQDRVQAPLMHLRAAGALRILVDGTVAVVVQAVAELLVRTVSPWQGPQSPDQGRAHLVGGAEAGSELADALAGSARQVAAGGEGVAGLGDSVPGTVAVVVQPLQASGAGWSSRHS